jgi:hypothetical protein
MRILQGSAIVAVAGVRDRHELREMLAAHLPLLPFDDEDPPVGEDGLAVVPDTASACRMARRMSRVWPAAGVRELLAAGFVAQHLPAVYAWRAARHGEHVFRIGPDGSFAPVAVFRSVYVQGRAGQWDSQLVASRPW